MSYILNKSKGRDVLRFLAIILALFLVVILNNLTSLKFENLIVEYDSKVVNITSMPFNEISPEVPGEFSISTDVSYHWYSQDSIKIYLDDCLESIKINGEIIPLSKLGKTELCSQSLGHDLEIGKLLKPGLNKIVITVNDFGGMYSFRIMNSIKSGVYIFFLFLTFILLSLMALLLLKNSKFNWIIILILFAGIILRVSYFGDVFYLVRAPDTDGHLQYIKFIVENHNLPDPNACFTCYSPPLYHIISSFIYYIAEKSNISDPYSLVYAFSLLLSVILLIYIYKIIMFFVKNLSLMSYLILGLASVWPALILFSVAINNDILSYTLLAMGLYYLLEYSNNLNISKYIIVVILTSFAILTKLSAGILTITLFIYLTVLLNQKKINFRKYLYLTIVALILFSICMYPAISRNVSIHGSHFTNNIIVGNSIFLPDLLRVNNSFENLLYLDINSYLKYPFIYGPYSNPEKIYYPNFLLKTFILGEYSFDKKYKDPAASLLAILLLFLVPAILIGLVISGERQVLHKNIIIIIFFITSFILHIILRLITPYSCSQNARYILLALVPALIFLNKFMDFVPRKKYPLLNYFCYFVIMLFITAAVILLFPTIN